jgi:predicted neutral ceramidase superfamily lipid hydrolase
MRYDIYFAMKPLHLICKTVGLYPHSFNHNTKKNSRQLNVLWSFSLILSLVVCFIYKLVTMIQNPTRRPHWMADVIYVCTDYVAGLGCLIFGVTTQRNKCQLINYKIKKIDEQFYLHNFRIHMYKKKRFTVIFYVILIISSTITLWCFLVYSWEDFLPSIFLICDHLFYFIAFIVSFRLYCTLGCYVTSSKEWIYKLSPQSMAFWMWTLIQT